MTDTSNTFRKQTREATNYDYHDREGRPRWRVKRYYADGKKKFAQQHWDGNRWVNGLADTKPPIYRLPEVQAAIRGGCPIFIVEGEKDVETLRRRGQAATTNAMGAGRWRDELSLDLMDAHAVLLPDNDPAGDKHMQDVAYSIYNCVESVKIVQLPGLAEKGDVTDWLNAGNSIENLHQLVEVAPTWHPEPEHPEQSAQAKSTHPGANTQQHGKAPGSQHLVPMQLPWGDPVPLHDHAVAAFPPDALPAWLHTYTHGVATELELDHGAVALLSLSVLANIYQRRYKVGISRGLAPHEEPLSLWVLFIAEPGERKSAVMKALLPPLSDYQKRYNAYMETAAAHYENGSDDGKGKQSSPNAPSSLALTLTDTTQEALVLTLQEQHERAGIFSTEGNSLFAVHLKGAYRNGAADVSLFNAAWSGDPVDVMRKRDRQRTTLYEPLLSMGVCIQPGSLSGASTNEVAHSSGFLSRWLYCCPDSNLGTRTHEPPALGDVPRQTYIREITRRLEEAFPLTYPAPAPEMQTISLEPAAYAAFVAYKKRVEPRLGNTHALSVYRDWFAKAPGQAVRIAGLLALIEGDAEPFTVRETHMQRGIAVVEWSARHMCRAYNISAGVDMALARRALALIQRKNLNVVTASNVRRGLNIDMDTAQETVQTLIDHGYLREIPRSRKTVEYMVHPAIGANLSTESANNDEVTDTASGSGGASGAANGCKAGCKVDILQQEGRNGGSANYIPFSTPPCPPTDDAAGTSSHHVHADFARSENAASERDISTLHPALHSLQREEAHRASGSAKPDEGDEYATALQVFAPGDLFQSTTEPLRTDDPAEEQSLINGNKPPADPGTGASAAAPPAAAQAAAPDLPDGWNLVRCDHKGQIGRFATWGWRVVHTSGQMTEPTQYRDTAIRDAWLQQQEPGQREREGE